MYCGGQPPDRSGGTPGYMDADKQDGHLPEKALVTTRETCRSAGHDLRGVARPSEGASPRLAASIIRAAFILSDESGTA